MLTQIRELLAYNDWANTRTLDAVEKLPADDITREIAGSFPSVWKTLTHIYGAEQSWFVRWQGTPEGLGAGPIVANDLPELREKWRAFNEKRNRWLDDVTDDALRRSIAIRVRSGLAFEQQLAATMRHVVNHSTYHRGQITNFLRHLGAAPVATDLVVYYMENPPA
jgi:uncharacterized damage-inducible protein DinB